MESEEVISKEISVAELLNLLKSKIVLLIFCALLGGGIAWGITKYMMKPTYETSTILCVISNIGKQEQCLVNDINASQKLVNTYMEVLKSPTILSKAIKRSQLPYTIKELQQMITTVSKENTFVFTVSIRGESAEDITNFLNSLVEVCINDIPHIVRVGSMRIVDKASKPNLPILPNVSINLVIGMAVGIGLAIFCILIQYSLDNTIKSKEELERCSSIPILGVIPKL